MPTTIDPLLRFLDYLGFVDVVLPFILLFTLVYAFLEKTKVLGLEKGHPYHRVNAIAAVVLSLLVVGSANLLGLTTSLVQYLGLLAVVVLAFAMLLGMFGIEHLPVNKWWNLVFFVVFMLMSVYVFSSLGLFGENNELFVALFIVFFLIVFAVKVWFAKEPQAQLPASPSPAGAHRPAERAPEPAPIGKNPRQQISLEDLSRRLGIPVEELKQELARREEEEEPG